MPNAIKYNVSTETLALKKGNFWIGTGDVGKGPTSSTGYYNGITPPSGGYTIYLNKVSGGPSIYTVTNDAQLITLTNHIAGQSFTTSGQCLNWFATQTDKMIFNRDYEPIVTSGLVLNLDAGFTPSYSQSGVTWYDVSSSENNCTLLNGPTYSSSNGGSIVFDGVDDYVSIPSSTNWNLSTSSTVSVWCKPTNGSGWVIAFDKGSWNGWLISGSGYFIYNGQPGYDDGVSVGGASLGSWQMFTVVVDRQNALYKGYKNGAYITQSSITQTPMTYATNLYLGSRGCVPDNFYNGATSTAYIYNRALTATEILQNYNAMKGRFGL